MNISHDAVHLVASSTPSASETSLARPEPDQSDDSLLAPLRGEPVSAPMHAVVTGRLIGFLRGQPLVTHSGHGCAVLARTIVDLSDAHIDQEVLMVFEEGRGDRPVILGWLRGDLLSPDLKAARDAAGGAVEVDVDGAVLQITAREQMVLRCGDSSITMTRAGKVLIRGRYISSLSSGVNRIKGGSVQIN